MFKYENNQFICKAHACTLHKGQLKRR